MSWNYRLIRHEGAGLGGGDFFAVGEVYYNADGTARGWNDATAWGDTPAECREVYAMMADAFNRPALDSKTLHEVAASPSSESPT